MEPLTLLLLVAGLITGASVAALFVRAYGPRITSVRAIGFTCLGLVTGVSATRAAVGWTSGNTPLPERPDKIGQFADAIRRDDHVLDQVYIACKQCTEVGPIVSAIDEAVIRARSAGAEPRVTWLLASSADHREIAAAAAEHRWLKCLTVDDAVAAELRGSVFIYRGDRSGRAYFVKAESEHYAADQNSSWSRTARKLQRFQEVLLQAQPCRGKVGS